MVEKQGHVHPERERAGERETERERDPAVNWVEPQIITCAFINYHSSVYNSQLTAVSVKYIMIGSHLFGALGPVFWLHQRIPGATSPNKSF